jgi:peptide methionine sulfoxide reductase MsrA
MQPLFETLPGVISTTVGYTGGHTKNPTYQSDGRHVDAAVAWVTMREPCLTERA